MDVGSATVGSGVILAPQRQALTLPAALPDDGAFVLVHRATALVRAEGARRSIGFAAAGQSHSRTPH
ncbi:hypothetical protein [Streptomyces ficellus]|uniref:Uncharacterized protein n=1 Tax=Streptomyces ficellus TaxID=1977088 RepID=A0A6I6F396_9ACTN|nr:hypothetical protein [Streptomyces ficellus]QGV77271.1 hypothetical protein EIZ62_02625 [Streptomyces ficellus]